MVSMYGTSSHKCNKFYQKNMFLLVLLPIHDNTRKIERELIVHTPSCVQIQGERALELRTLRISCRRKNPPLCFPPHLLWFFLGKSFSLALKFFSFLVKFFSTMERDSLTFQIIFQNIIGFCLQRRALVNVVSMDPMICPCVFVCSFSESAQVC